MTRTVEASPGTDLAARYGRTPARRQRRRWFAIAAALVFAAVIGAWVVWAGLDAPDPVLEAQDIGYEKVGDDQVTVRWQLSAAPGTEVRCAVQALDERYEVVGWKVVDIPPSDQVTRAFSNTLRTVSPATTGLISRCWLP